MRKIIFNKDWQKYKKDDQFYVDNFENQLIFRDVDTGNEVARHDVYDIKIIISLNWAVIAEY